MTQLDQLKQDLATLAERINKATEIADGQVHLTKEQLKKLISIVQEQTIEYIKDEIKNTNLDGDDYVSLDLYDREIQVDLDSHSLLREINDNIDSPDEATDSELDDLMNKIIEQDI
jgi:hypothetical protein